MDISHAVIKTNDFILIDNLLTLVAKESKHARNIGAIGSHHSAFAGGHILRWVEAKGGDAAPSTSWSAIESCQVGLRRVFDQNEIVLFADRFELIHRSDMSV